MNVSLAVRRAAQDVFGATTGGLRYQTFEGTIYLAVRQVNPVFVSTPCLLTQVRINENDSISFYNSEYDLSLEEVRDMCDSVTINKLQADIEEMAVVISDLEFERDELQQEIGVLLAQKLTLEEENYHLNNTGAKK